MDGKYYADTSSATFVKDDNFATVWAINVIGNLNSGKQTITTYYFSTISINNGIIGLRVLNTIHLRR